LYIFMAWRLSTGMHTCYNKTSRANCKQVFSRWSCRYLIM
jgi:hypothetical protein